MKWFVPFKQIMKSDLGIDMIFAEDEALLTWRALQAAFQYACQEKLFLFDDLRLTVLKDECLDEWDEITALGCTRDLLHKISGLYESWIWTILVWLKRV